MKVSVCIPTYNQSQYLAQSVRSAFMQTIQPAEIIIANDCSTDDTADVLEKLSQEISIIRIINQEKNLGISKNTDICLRSAISELIIRLDSDDILEPTYIEKLAPLFNQFPDAAYAHAAVQEIDQHGNMLRKRMLARKSGYQNSEDALLAAKKGYRVAANIIMFRRSALEKVNFIGNQLNFAEDFYLSASLAAHGYGNVYSNEILANYRIWTDAGKVRQKRKLMEIQGMHKVFSEVLEPAYRNRNWDVQQLSTQRTSFATTLADCLGWHVYTSQEKTELKEALQQLSSSKKTTLFIWLHSHGFGGVFNLYNRSFETLRLLAKKVLMSA